MSISGLSIPLSSEEPKPESTEFFELYLTIGQWVDLKAVNRLIRHL